MSWMRRRMLVPAAVTIVGLIASAGALAEARKDAPGPWDDPAQVAVIRDAVSEYHQAAWDASLEAAKPDAEVPGAEYAYRLPSLRRLVAESLGSSSEQTATVDLDGDVLSGGVRYRVYFLHAAGHMAFSAPWGVTTSPMTSLSNPSAGDVPAIAGDPELPTPQQWVAFAWPENGQAGHVWALTPDGSVRRKERSASAAPVPADLLRAHKIEGPRPGRVWVVPDDSDWTVVR